MNHPQFAVASVAIIGLSVKTKAASNAQGDRGPHSHSVRSASEGAQDRTKPTVAKATRIKQSFTNETERGLHGAPSPWRVGRQVIPFIDRHTPCECAAMFV